MAKKAVLGVIGAGHLANSQHLPSLMHAPDAHLKTGQAVAGPGM